jgi:hypothetical protein
MPEKKQSLITVQVAFAAVILGICLCLLMWIVQYLIFPNIIIEGKEKIQIRITPFSEVSDSPELPSDRSDQLGLKDTPSMPGVVAVGMMVKISGTENEGLRMHSDAGIGQPSIYLAQEGERYKIIDGPKIMDGLIWWKIEGSEDKNKVGWSVQDYLNAN